MGFLIDIAALAVIVSFGWAGYTLGLVRSSIRLVAALGAIGLAVLLRAPVAKVLLAITPFGDDFSSLLGMLIVGALAYLGVATLVTYYAGWAPHERLRDADRALGAIPGVVLGASWCALMVSLLVLTPSDSVLSRGSISSISGKTMIGGMPGVLRWFDDTFPHYTQTLPKGRRGAITQPRKGNLSLRADEIEDDPKEAGVLLANINQLRSARDKPELVWNIDVAKSAARHSHAMAANSFFGYTTPGGLELEDRIKGSLGNNVGLYDTFGEQIVWAHGAANAYAALVNDPKAREIILDEHLTEMGIGVVDAGWFNGRMFTIGLIGRARVEDPAIGDITDDVATTTPDPGSSTSTFSSADTAES